ncbi:MAG: HIT domain-containing protein [Anaerolineales bacterium]|nr:HIT domain-containing protein [Anaerolineales bacterium]
MKYIWSPWRMSYIQKHKDESGCVFCVAQDVSDGTENLILFRGQRAFVILNRYPYTSGHLMVVPYQHEASLEGLDSETRAELLELANQIMKLLGKEYHPQGFNVGINIGEAAGAGITEHVHLHVVPRWSGDTNFMSSLGETRVLPETLADTYQRLKKAWQQMQS